MLHYENGAACCPVYFLPVDSASDDDDVDAAIRAEPRLIDGDAEQTRKIRFKDRMFDLYLNDTVVTLLFQSMKPKDQKDQERIDTAKFRIDTMYSFMEHDFGQQPYANGDKFTMSDCAAAPALLLA